MRMNLFRWLLVPMVVLAACTKPDSEPTPEPEPDPSGVFDDTVKGTVKFTSEPKFTFPGEGDQKALVFTVDCNWKADGTRVYSPSTRVREAADISFDVPSGCEKLWLVVAATPERYLQHLWDEDNTNDEVWPFRVRFEGTNLFGARDDSWPVEPQNTVIERNVTTSASAGYGGTSLDLDDDAVMEIGKALCLAPNDIVAALTTDFNNVKTSDVKFVAIRPDGSVDDAFLTMSADDYYSANNFGFWFDAEGGRSTWSASCLYLEHTPSSWSFQFGVHPDKVKAKALNPGDRYTIQVAYLYAGVTATLKFNVTITD